MKRKIIISIILFAGLFVSAHLFAQPISPVVKADQPKATVQSTMWGVFFEDINFAADGGQR